MRSEGPALRGEARSCFWTPQQGGGTWAPRIPKARGRMPSLLGTRLPREPRDAKMHPRPGHHDRNAWARSVSTRRFPGHLPCPNPSGQLCPGMVAAGTLHVAQSQARCQAGELGAGQLPASPPPRPIRQSPACTEADGSSAPNTRRPCPHLRAAAQARRRPSRPRRSHSRCPGRAHGPRRAASGPTGPDGTRVRRARSCL